MPLTHRLKELSLFTGAGGGLLGTIILGWKHIGYVEYNQYCQRIIKQRIIDGVLDDAPIFGDIRAFISEGFAGSYTELVDVITAGFPCQPFSVAGQRHGENDERNMWPQTIECVRIIRPSFVFLENVPGLLAHRYIQRIFGDLAESGYNARWCVLGADDVGAPHKRKRLWIIAKSNAVGRGWLENNKRKTEEERDWNQRTVIKNATSNSTDARVEVLRQERKDSILQIIANTKGIGGGAGLCEIEQEQNRNQSGNSGRDITDTSSKGLQGRKRPGSHDQKQAAYKSITERNNTWIEPWPEVATRLCRVDDGVAHRVDRLKSLGNGQVPRVVSAAWNLLMKDNQP